MLKPTAILLLAILISFNPPLILQAQDKKDDKDQTIRLKSELVQVRAVVTDKRGQLVDNLKKEDFELLENTRAQNISFFSVERINSEPAGADKPN